MAWILVVDDEDDLRRGVSQFLKRAGHRVDEAANGTAAMSIVEEHPVDLVLTDINMPDMDGIEVIVRLTRMRPDVPIISMSGGGRLPKELLLGNAEMLGAVSTISKPFELAELRAAVDSALTRDPHAIAASGA